MAQYELWDSNTGNLLGVYEDEDSALAMIHASLTADGAGLWRDVGLLKVGDTACEDELIAEGEELIDRARPRTQARRPG